MSVDGSELKMTKNGHSIVSDDTDGYLIYRCTDCNATFLNLDAVEERFSCPV